MDTMDMLLEVPEVKRLSRRWEKLHGRRDLSARQKAEYLRIDKKLYGHYLACREGMRRVGQKYAK